MRAPSVKCSQDYPQKWWSDAGQLFLIASSRVTPPEDVPGVKEPGNAQRDRPTDAKSSEQEDGQPGVSVIRAPRSLGDREGRRTPGDRGGRAEFGTENTPIHELNVCGIE